MGICDDWFRNYYIDENTWNSTFNAKDYYGVFGPSKKIEGSNLIRDTTITLEDINKLFGALLDNTLPKSQIVTEKITIDDDGLFNLELVVIRDGEDKQRTYKVKIEEIVQNDSDDEKEPEETTDYFKA